MNDKNDCSFLNEVKTNKYIVLLGGQSQGDGAAFDGKVIMIKYLNQRQGFNIVFERFVLKSQSVEVVYAKKH